MNKVFDLALDLPLSTIQVIDRHRYLHSHLSEETLPPVLGQGGSTSAVAVLEGTRYPLIDTAEKTVTTLPQFIEQMDEAGIELGVIDAGSTEKTAEIVKKYPGRFAGAITVNPYRGMKAVKELEQAVKDYGMRCYYTNASRFGLRVNDKKYYPLYAKSVELDIPVLLQEADTLWRADTIDITEPLYIDEVATDFPEMRIVAGLGNWPWSPEIIGLARRHDNLYISLAAYDAIYVYRKDAMKQLAEALQDRIVFTSGPFTRPSSIKNMVEQAMNTDLSSDIRDKWLQVNARRLFKL